MTPFFRKLAKREQTGTRDAGTPQNRLAARRFQSGTRIPDSIRMSLPLQQTAPLSRCIFSAALSARSQLVWALDVRYRLRGSRSYTIRIGW
jgi:uncharacterized lipoprotein YbaY